MKFLRYCLTGLLVFLCLFGSCSMVDIDMENFLTTGNTSQDEKGTKEKSEKEDEEKKKEDEKEKEKEKEEEKEKEKEEEKEKEKEKEKEEEDENPNEGGDEDETGDDSEEIPPTPDFLSCKAESETEIALEFTQPVMLVYLNFIPEMEYTVIEEGSVIKINLTKDHKPGMLVEADFLVEDEYGNTVENQVTFNLRNDHVPKMQINELRTEYSNSNDIQKVEFIELKMLSDGNLGALRVFTAGNNSNSPIFEFAPVKVKAGDYVLLHLRTLGTSSIDEYGENLNESGGVDSCPTARDFWIPGKTDLLLKTAAVYVLDQDDKVLDAVMIAEKPDPVWGTKYLADTADFLFSKGAWKSPEETICSPANAVSSSSTTITRTICRDETVENTHTAADWYITVNNGGTPGQKNNIKRY